MLVFDVINHFQRLEVFFAVFLDFFGAFAPASRTFSASMYTGKFSPPLMFYDSAAWKTIGFLPWKPYKKEAEFAPSFVYGVNE